MEVEDVVKERYAEGAKAVEPQLCCPVSYDTKLLKLIPKEIVDRDYGCGDPSRYVRPGDTVLDLGSGGGKICYMAAQLVGEGGRVIGVDMTDDMLALARGYQGEMAAKLGEERVRFHKGRIQDLALDLDLVAQYLADNPVVDLATYDSFASWQQQLSKKQPMVADESVDLVVSNCVLNLVAEEEREAMIRGIFRVLKPGGRVAISDIVADQVVPEELKKDAKLWSGCISGAFPEDQFVAAFYQAGFDGVAFDKWDENPWQVVAGIEFRSVTLTAFKNPQPAKTERGHAVIYRGPFAEVTDAQGNRYPAGERIAVSAESFDRLGREPFVDSFVRLAPKDLLPSQLFTAAPGTRRPAQVTRGGAAKTGDSCSPKGGCC